MIIFKIIFNNCRITWMKECDKLFLQYETNSSSLSPNLVITYFQDNHFLDLTVL